jgi:hypothetical protein
MSDTPPPPGEPDLDPAHQLQRDIYLAALNTLRDALPLVVDETPDAWFRRARAAIAQVAAMVPANADEAGLAASAVAARAQATACYGQIAEHAGDFAGASKARAQAASMGRESRGYQSLLLRVQAVRIRREANDAARDSAAWTERAVQGLMTDALATVPPPRPPAPAAAPAATAAAPPVPAPPAPPGPAPVAADHSPLLCTPRPRLTPPYRPPPPGSEAEAPESGLLDDDAGDDRDIDDDDDDLDAAAD